MVYTSDDLLLNVTQDAVSFALGLRSQCERKGKSVDAMAKTLIPHRPFFDRIFGRTREKKAEHAISELNKIAGICLLMAAELAKGKGKETND